MIDSIFPFTPFGFYLNVIGRLGGLVGYFTSQSFKKLLKEDFIRKIAHQLRRRRRWERTYSQLRDLIVYRSLLRQLSRGCQLTVSVILDRTHLVDEDSLTKFFNELDDCSGVLLLIEDPGHLPFPQQHKG